MSKIRRFIRDGILPAEQVMRCAPAPATLKTNGSRLNWRAKSRVEPKTTTRNRCFPPFEKGLHNESVFVTSLQGSLPTGWKASPIGSTGIDDESPLDAWIDRLNADSEVRAGVQASQFYWLQRGVKAGRSNGVSIGLSRCSDR